MSWSFSPYILWFQVLSNYLIHFKLIFCEWYKISYPVFLQHFFWRDYSFPLEYSWLPCQIFAYHICGVYLLAIHYGSLVQEFICQHIYYFDYYRFLIWFETWELWFLQLCSFSGLFWPWGIFCSSTQILGVLFLKSLWKRCHFHKDYIELINGLG